MFTQFVFSTRQLFMPGYSSFLCVETKFSSAVFETLPIPVDIIYTSFVMLSSGIPWNMPYEPLDEGPRREGNEAFAFGG